MAELRPKPSLETQSVAQESGHSGFLLNLFAGAKRLVDKLRGTELERPNSTDSLSGIGASSIGGATGQRSMREQAIHDMNRPSHRH